MPVEVASDCPFYLNGFNERSTMESFAPHAGISCRGLEGQPAVGLQ